MSVPTSTYVNNTCTKRIFQGLNSHFALAFGLRMTCCAYSNDFCSDFQTLVMKRSSLLEIMALNTPCLNTIYLLDVNSCEFFGMVSLMGKKCADFVNRQTIT